MLWLAGLVAVVLGGCATGPDFDTTGVREELQPREAVREIDTFRNTRVFWGGVIVNTENLEQGTRLEVVAYPLDSNQKPDLDEPPLGRFLVREDTYLETIDYRQGRLITVLGTLIETQEGMIGETRYTYPVVSSERMHLWPVEPTGGGFVQPRVQFGVGIILSN